MNMRGLRFNQFGDPSVLHIADVPDAHATAHEAVIRVEAASVNASDVKNVAGQMDWTRATTYPGTRLRRCGRQRATRMGRRKGVGNRRGRRVHPRWLARGVNNGADRSTGT